MRKLLLVVLFITGGYTSFATAWHQKTHFGGVARHRGAGISIGNKGYMGLGHYNGGGPNIVFQDWWEFDPSSNTWSQKANYPIQTYATSQFSIGTKAYVGCGIFNGATWYCYDAIANAWTPIPDCPAAASDQVGFSVNGKGYFIFSNVLYEYDPILNAWSAKTNPPFSSGMWSSTFTIADKAYVKTNNQLYEYKSATDEWALRAPFPGVATGGSASFAVNGKGYIVCGGYIGWLSELTNEVWEYDPTTNTWKMLEEFPAMARRFTSGFAIGDKGYVGIGTNGTNMRDFWEFDELLSGVDENEMVVAEPYPNPSTDQVLFTVNTNEPAYIRIFDPAGKEVYHSAVIQNTLSITKNELNAGVFIYQVYTESQTLKTGKLIFQ
jgi:N-acetylneuraminic acid mutarotase